MTTAPRPPAPASHAAAPTAPLDVRSEAIDLTGGLLGRLPASEGALAWVRDGQGLVGWGEAARLEVRGAGPVRPGARLVARAARAHHGRTTRSGAVGTGPVAFG